MDVDRYGLRVGLAPSPIPVGAASIAELIGEIAPSDRTFFIDRNGSTSCAAFLDRVHALAAALSREGIEAGDMVSASAMSVLDFAVAFFAVQRIGAVWACISLPLAGPEKIAQVADSGASIFIGDDQTIAQIEQGRDELPNLERILSVGGADSGVGQMIAANLESRFDGPLPDPLLPAMIGYTSGTTGLPKGVVHSQHSIMAYLNACIYSDEGGQWLPGLRRGISLPLTNLNVMIYGPVAALAAGGSFVAIARADAEGVGDWIDRHAIEVINAAPPTVRDLLSRPDLQRLSLKSLRAVAVGGAPPSQDMHDAFRARFGFELIADYGQTESPSSIASTLMDCPSPVGSTGKAHPHLQLAVFDATGRVVAPGETGEICAKARDTGPWAGVYTGMLGCWRRPEETREAFHGDWLRTGDVGFLDETGNLTLVGRKKEMILRGGVNVYPAEIEHVLRGSPRVKDVVVIGLPDERLGEVVAAFVESPEGQHCDDVLATELRNRCIEKLAKYKVPERWFAVDAFPRSAMNKPLRHLVAELPKAVLMPEH